MRLTLSSKLVSVVALVVVLIVPPAAYLSLSAHRTALEDAHHAQGRTIVQLLDAMFSEPVDLEQPELSTFSRLQRHLWLNPDVLAIEVLTVQQGQLRVAVSTRPERKGLGAGPLEAEVFASHEFARAMLDTPDGRVARYLSPIHLSRDVVGVVAADVTLEVLDARLAAEMRTWLVGAATFIAVLATALFFALRRVVILPVREFARGVAAIRRGDRELELSVRTCDEFGALSDDFNHMAAELKESERRASHLALHDPLTDLPNRRLFVSSLKIALEAAERYHRRGALLYVDLDNFKQVNDTLGHAAGDIVLCEAATRLKATVRRVDTVARLGGDEFVILLHELPEGASSDFDKVTTVGRKLLDAFAPPMEVEDTTVRIGLSIGVRVFDGNDVTVEAIVRDADEALYMAKRDGRNRQRVFEVDQILNARRRDSIARALPDALKQTSVEAFLQPQVDLHGQVRGAEVLLRWQMPEWGRVPPGECVAVAEQLNLSDAISDAMTSAAARVFHACAEQGTALERIAINVTASQFADETFAERVIGLRDALELPWGALEIELTESALLKDIDAAAGLIERMRTHGIRFSIDDFGTGYSSFEYLKRLPVDSLKVDKLFVDDLMHDQRTGSLVAAMLRVADDIGVDVVAEGVESRVQFDALVNLGCRTFQGFYFSEALPVAQFLRLMHAPNMPVWVAERRRA